MRQIFLLVLVISPGLLLAQNSQELDNRNGFQDIELLTDISTKVELEHWKPQKDKPRHDLYRPAKGAYESIGNVRIYKLIVYTYRNLAYKIEIITQKDEQLFRSLEKAFGKIKYSMGSQISYWEGENVRLTYESLSKSKIKLTYSAKGINQIIAADKKKAIDSLSSEF